MHILTRQVNEGVLIGDEVEVTVLEIGDDFVRLGVTSPDTDPPYREHVIFVDPKELELPPALRKRMQFC